MDELRKELKQLEKRKLKARNANDLAEEAKLCNVAGELLSENRLFEEAMLEHETELSLSESLNDTIAVAISHRRIGECLCECKDFKNALYHQQKYLELSRKSQSLVEEQRAFATIGRTWFISADSSSDMLNAQFAFLESLSICEQLRDIVKEKELLEMRARLYLNLGLVYNNLNNKKKGMKYMEKALAIAVNQSLKDTEYRCHFSLGEAKSAEGRPAEALQCFERARKVAQHQKKKFDEADTLVQMGQVLISLGDFKGGKNILKKCFKSMKHGNHVGELRSSLITAIKGTRLLEKLRTCREKGESLIKVFEDLGDLFAQVKCYRKSIEYYLKQFELSENLNKPNQEKAVICVSLAVSYFDNKQYNKAKEYYLKELHLRDGEPDEQCNTWCHIARITETSAGSYENIEEAYNNALLCAKNSQKTNRQVGVLKLLAESQKKFSRKTLLEETLREISVLEECKMEEDSEEVEEDGEEEEDDDEGEQLIKEEMEFSDGDEDEDEGFEKNTGRVKRTNVKSINKRNEKGETILHCAAIKGDYNLGRTSIEKGVSVHSRDYCGWQPLHEACNHGHLNIVELLLDNGADINDSGGPHCRGMTPLHDATQNGNVDVVQLLVARGASLTMKNKDGYTPLNQVLNAIAADEEDPDDENPDLFQIRQELKEILSKATSLKKSPATHLPEMKRRDQIDIYESDEEPCSSMASENHEDSTNPSVSSRKRKSVLLDPESEEESDDFGQCRMTSDDVVRPGVSKSKKYEKPTIGNKTKVARISRNLGISESENLDRFSEGSWEDSGDLIETDSAPNEILSDLREDRLNDFEKPELTTSPSLSKQHWQAPLDSPEPLNFANEEQTFSGNTEETRIQLLPPRGKNSSWKTTSRDTNRASVGNARNTSAQNHGSINKGAYGINHRNSTAFLDPLTGSTQRETRVSDSPALIPENEYLDSSAASTGWLIDDMPRKTGKRKRSSDIRSMLGSSETQRNVPQVSASRSRGSCSAKKTGSTLRQSRLSNHVVSGRARVDDPWENEAPDSPEPAGFPAASGLPGSDHQVKEVSMPMRLRVKVEDKMFLIACPTAAGDKKTVQWLAEEATSRYYRACGLKLVLSLSTAEGAWLSPDDQITDLLSNNEQVIARVENLVLPPLVERYKAACSSANKVYHKQIVEVFQSNAQLASVEFPDMALTPAHLLPLFRALQCHEQLVKLSLPGNRMGDTGLQHLVSALPHLPNLAIVILSSNGISHKGLRHLASTLTECSKSSKTWLGLKELDFSFNPFNDVAAPNLATILRSCSHLQKLNIDSCDLSETSFQQRSVLIEAILDLTRLRHFRISSNPIMADGLRPLLDALSYCPVELLDVSYTTRKHDPAFAKSLAEYLNKDSCCIQEFVCQGCFLRDDDVRLLARANSFLQTIVKLDFSLNEIGREGGVELAFALESSKCRKHLNLSGNVNLTSASLPQFLTPSAGKCLQRLDLSVCGLTSPLPIEFENPQTLILTKILKFLNLSHNSIQEPDKDKLTQWWNAMWGELSCISMEPPFIVFTIRQLTD